MKNLKNDENIFSELVDLVMQSIAVSGSDEVIKELYRCEQYPDKCDGEARYNTLRSLKTLAVKNKKAYKDNNSEKKIWEDVIKILS